MGDIDFNYQIRRWVDSQIDVVFAPNLRRLLNVKTAIWFKAARQIPTLERGGAQVANIDTQLKGKHFDEQGERSIGELLYRFSRPWSDNTIGIKLSALELIEKKLPPWCHAHHFRRSSATAWAEGALRPSLTSR